MTEQAATREDRDQRLALGLREALQAAGFTHEGVAAGLGTTGHAALSRNETLPGLRATGGGSPVETLTRLWLLQVPVPVAAVGQALPDLVDPLCNAGLLERSVGEVRARAEVRPCATEDVDLWVASDLTPGLDGRPALVATDHVLGISSAATSLAQLTVRVPVDRALDLGTGCGVQALHLAGHSRHVVATDVNQRALRLTRFNAALNGVAPTARSAGRGIEVRAGSFFEPVAGEQFDLVATNPPFVISPATGERLVYRDSGLPGDRVVEHIVRGVPAVLREGGVAQVLANWMVLRDQPWDERLSSWVEGCDAWVVQREVVDLPTYVELWLKDGGQHPSTGRASVEEYHRRYDTWLSWFDEQDAVAVGFGWINLRRLSGGSGRAATLRLEDWPYDVEQPIGTEVHGFFERAATLGGLDDEGLLATRLEARSDLRQETYGAPGVADPEEVVLRQQRWARRARRADTVEAGLVGACDGDLDVGQILDALATLLGQDANEVRAAYLPVVRDLVTEGFLTPKVARGDA